MLNLTADEPLPASELAPPAKRRNPLLALFLSMLLPGLGHFYVGLHRNAAWIAGSEAAILLLIANASGTVHANAVFAFPAIWGFAMADAYFSAREWNAGVTPLMIGASPRITAILNLLTKGFGYFYLGDRTKGILCFLVFTAVQAVILLHTNVWTSVLAVTIQAAIAVDGYRVARQRLLTSHPELAPMPLAEDGSSPGSVIDRANQGGLKPSIATAIFTAIFGAIVMGYGVFRAIEGHAVTSPGSIEQGPAGLIYRNAKERITLTAPSDWSPMRTEDSLVQLRTDGASVIAQELFSIASVDSSLSVTQAGIQRRHPKGTFTPCSTLLEGRSVPCFEASFKTSGGVQMHQRIVGLRRFVKVFFLIETWTSPEHRPVLDEVEKNLHLF